MAEIWKDIQEYEGYYQVSNLGNVKAVRRSVVYKYKHGDGVRIFPEHITKPWKRKDGYLSVTLTKNKTKKTFLIHRLVANAFIELNGKPEVNHIDGNKENNLAVNLEWVTDYENKVHSINIGLRDRITGEQNPSNKLSKLQVKEIKRLNDKGGYSQKAIGDLFGVSQSLVSMILRNEIWQTI
jgi:predicted XRE-type DNA-binding protein